jgi:threonine aldolase
MPDTNLVYIDTSDSGMDAAELARRAAEQGVLISVMGQHKARVCMHLDVSSAMVEEAAGVIRAIAA